MQIILIKIKGHAYHIMVAEKKGSQLYNLKYLNKMYSMKAVHQNIKNCYLEAVELWVISILFFGYFVLSILYSNS